MNDAEGDGFLHSDRRFVNPVGFKLPGELYVQSVVGLGVGGLPGVWETSQEVGCRNHPPCLRNRLLPKLVHSALGVLGVMDTVPAEFQDVNARGGKPGFEDCRKQGYLVKDECGKFQVGVGDIPFPVRGGDEVGDDVCQPGVTPHQILPRVRRI